eukprot:825324_1
MSHNSNLPYTTQSNARYGLGSSFHNKSMNKSLLSTNSINTSFNGNSSMMRETTRSMLYPKSQISNKPQKIISRITWNDTFSIPIACGKSKCVENPDLEAWKNTHYTKLKPNNNRKVSCGGLLWNIYIH